MEGLDGVFFSSSLVVPVLFAGLHECKRDPVKMNMKAIKKVVRKRRMRTSKVAAFCKKQQDGE